MKKTVQDAIDETINPILEDSIKIAAPILAQKADGSYRDAMNELQMFLANRNAGLNSIFSVENIWKAATPEQRAKVPKEWLVEHGYEHLLTVK